MNSILLAFVDAVGGMGFLMAMFWGLRNYMSTTGESNYWLMFTVAMATGAFWTLLGPAYFFGIYPELVDNIQALLITILATLLGSASLVAHYSAIRRKAV